MIRDFVRNSQGYS